MSKSSACAWITLASMAIGHRFLNSSEHRCLDLLGALLSPPAVLVASDFVSLALALPTV